MTDDQEKSSQEKDDARSPERRPIFTRNHEKASLSRWIIPLVIILAVIFFLPRVVETLLSN